MTLGAKKKVAASPPPPALSFQEIGRKVIRCPLLDGGEPFGEVISCRLDPHGGFEPVEGARRGNGADFAWG